MLLAWSEAGEMDRRIWVDFADKPGDGHLFRLRVTTINQPFGFQKASPSAKLSLREKRDALEAFENEHKVENPNKKELFEKAKPHLSKLPIDLRLLVESWKNNNGDKFKWIRDIEEKLDQIKNEKRNSQIWCMPTLNQAAICCLSSMFSGPWMTAMPS
jgi:hypothetical protein